MFLNALAFDIIKFIMIIQINNVFHNNFFNDWKKN